MKEGAAGRKQTTSRHPLNVRRITMGLAGVLTLAVVGFVIFASRAVLPQIDPPSPDSFATASVRRGAQLAALGECGACHTAAGGEPFAGGRPVHTPFGTIYSTNITPDPTTGIGHWSKVAFQRAMHEGVGRDGRHLYPAFPYDHFTLVSGADNDVLYAFLMTRRPVQAQTPPNQLAFPANIRLLLAAWKLLFFHAGVYNSDAAHDEIWNRGAYLANGLGHCGACHTPRGRFAEEAMKRSFAGGDAEGWHAYALNSDSPARAPWNAQDLHAYLRNGWHPLHGDAYGPMVSVVAGTSSVADSDVVAIATFLAGALETPPMPPAAHPPDLGADSTHGAAIYAGACAACHDGGRPLPFGGMRLDLSSAVTDERPTNLINVVLEGLHPPEGASAAIMPGFAGALSDHQLESLLAYVRAEYGRKPAWSEVEAQVRKARSRDRD
jgi:mono/diheme cytochrome c family protein